MKRAFFLAFGSFGLLFAVTSPASGGGPITKGPWMQHVTPTSAVVRVEVDPPAPVTLEVGMSTAPGTADAGNGSVIESREVRALHTILVAGLQPATRYAFTVRAHGAPRYGALTTAPPDESGAPVRFLVYGDTRSDDAAHAAVVRAMVSATSDFIINTGDIVENGASRSQWQTFFDIEAPLTRERPIFCCVGNHELTEGAGLDFVRYFGPAPLPIAPPPSVSTVTGIPVADAGPSALTLDQLNGTFRWSNVRFFMINGLVDYNAGPSRVWLEKVLGESDLETGVAWRIVVVHHGPWSSGPHGDNARLHAAKVPELLRAHKVDLVISGHEHIYERGVADGLAYLVSGGGGAPLYRVKKAAASSRHYESAHHFIEAATSTAAIQFVATRPDGSTIERCALRKVGGWDCDGEKSTAAAPTSPAPAPSSRCGCRVPGGPESTPTAVSLLGVLALAWLTARRRSVR